MNNLAPFSVASMDHGMPDFMSLPKPTPDSISMLAPPIVAQVAGAPALLGTTHTIPCRFPGCLLLFKGNHERNRHEDNVHLHIAGSHVCLVSRCKKNTDGGYKRADKLTEHMWKAHGDLGYAKRV